MNPIERIKIWWKSKTPLEKFYMIFGGITATAAVAGAVCSIKNKYDPDDLKITVKLYPGGKDDPNPVTLAEEEKPEVEQEPELKRSNPMLKEPVESRSQFKEAVDIFNELQDSLSKDIDDDEVYNVSIDKWQDLNHKALMLAWDLAAVEDRMDEAVEIIPFQAFD